jgi:hypothetical protein
MQINAITSRHRREFQLAGLGLTFLLMTACGVEEEVSEAPDEATLTVEEPVVTEEPEEEVLRIVATPAAAATMVGGPEFPDNAQAPLVASPMIMASPIAAAATIVSGPEFPANSQASPAASPMNLVDGP